MIYNFIVLNDGNKFFRGFKIVFFYKCIICGKCYKNKANWSVYFKLYDKEEVFMCGFCG